MTAMAPVRVLCLWAAMAAGATTGAPVSQAPDRPVTRRVLVMPFAVDVDRGRPDGAGASLWLGEAAAVLLRSELSRHGLTPVSRDQAVSVFDRLQLPLSAVLTRATVIRVGELLGATEVVFGDVHYGPKLSVRARLLSLDEGADRVSIEDEAALADLFDLFERVGDELARATGRAIGPAAGAAPAHLPLEAFEDYVKGLVAATPAAQQRFLESALKVAPQNPDVLCALWTAYSAQGAHDKALSVVSAVPRDSSLGHLARFRMALSLMDLGRLDGAFQELTSLYADEPLAVVSNALGVVQLRRGAAEPGQSPVTYFRRATEEDPGNTMYLFNLGYASALSGDVASGLFWLREAVRYDAADGEAHLVLSAALLATGRRAEAQRELDLARQLGTRFDPATLTLTDQVPPSLVRIAPDLDPLPAERPGGPIGNPAARDQQETAAFHLEHAKRLIEAEDDREAIDELRRAIYLAPYEDEPHVLLGEAYRRAGRLQEAIEELRVAIWCRETVAARVALGEALLDSGDAPGARSEAMRALVLDPASEAAKGLLKRAEGRVTIS